MPSIDVVVVNWRRPGNLLPIAQAFRQQTVACRLVICDVSDGSFPLPKAAADLADEVFVWRKNYGSFNRFVPCLGYESEFIWFHDDDMVPGRSLLEFMLQWHQLPFAVMGQSGRLIDGRRYCRVQGGPTLRPVSIVCRGYFVRTADLAHLHCFVSRHREPGLINADDILLCRSIVFATGKPVLVTPRPSTEQAMNKTELPAPFAVHHAPGNRRARLNLFEKLQLIKSGGKRRIFVITAPPPRLRSLGDHAQLLGLDYWLRKHAPDDEVIILDKDQSKLSIRFEIGPQDLILCHPCGNLGDRGLWSEEGRRLFLLRYRSTKIVVLPQTIFFSETEKGQREMERTRQVYAGHPNLHIHARDEVSRALAERLFPAARSIKAAPDFALLIDRQIHEPTPVNVSAPALLCLRKSDEKRRNWDAVAAIVSSKVKICGAVSTLATINVTEGIRRHLVAAAIQEFSHGSVIITDCLHGLIFAYLARRPCVVLPGIDHNLMAAADWFKEIPWIRTVLDCTGIPAALDAVLSVKEKLLEGVDFTRNFTDLADSTLAHSEDLASGVTPQTSHHS